MPIFRSEKFAGKSGAGVYGDVMMELDWSIGEIMKSLKENDIDNNTFVIMTSDNGPWTSYGNHAGHTPFREAKGTSFDGGTRSACIMRYPGKIKAGTISNRTMCTIDLLPTFAKLAGAELPKNSIDGLDVWDLIVDKNGAQNPHEYYAFSSNKTFEGVISGNGQWKLHLPHSYRTLVYAGNDGNPGEYREAQQNKRRTDAARNWLARRQGLCISTSYLARLIYAAQNENVTLTLTVGRNGIILQQD